MNETANGARIVFSSLPGTWAVERRAGDIGSFAGRAVFERITADGLHYREDGILTPVNGEPVQGYREFDYRLEGDRLLIRFGEAHRRHRVFVRLRFERCRDGFAACDVHACEPDTYEHRLHWSDADRFRTVTAVRGPRKDYVLETRYTRLRG